MDPKVLKGTPLSISNVPERDLAAFASLFERIEFKKGGILCEEGQKQTRGFVIERGDVGRYKKSPNGALIRIGSVEGSAGLLHLIKGDPAFAQLMGESDGLAWGISQDSFRNFCQEHPAFLYELLGDFGSRIRKLSRLQPVHEPGVHVAIFSSTLWFKNALAQINTEGLVFHFFEEKLDQTTAALAKDCTVVCCFVNDILDAPTVDILSTVGIKMIAMRCAGFDRLDIERIKVGSHSLVALQDHCRPCSCLQSLRCG